MFPFSIKLFILTVLPLRFSSYKHLFLYIIKPVMTNLWHNKKTNIPRFTQNHNYFKSSLNFSIFSLFMHCQHNSYSCQVRRTVNIMTIAKYNENKDFYISENLVMLKHNRTCYFSLFSTVFPLTLFLRTRENTEFSRIR